MARGFFPATDWNSHCHLQCVFLRLCVCVCVKLLIGSWWWSLHGVSDEVWNDSRGMVRMVGVNDGGMEGVWRMGAGAWGPIPSTEAIVRSECWSEEVEVEDELAKGRKGEILHSHY